MRARYEMLVTSWTRPKPSHPGVPLWTPLPRRVIKSRGRMERNVTRTTTCPGEALGMGWVTTFKVLNGSSRLNPSWTIATFDMIQDSDRVFVFYTLGFGTEVGDLMNLSMQCKLRATVFVAVPLGGQQL